MVQTIQATDLTLHDLRTKFGLTLIDDDQFFPEWLEGLPELTESEQQGLDRVKANYLDLVEQPMIESTVKMVVLAPLLDLAGFYRLPFRITAETSITVAAEDEGVLIQGRIDVLVLQEQFWILVIESKRPTFSVDLAIPQALSYMLGNPNPQRPSFGLITNGSQFLFLKLTRQDSPKYALSNLFSLLNRGNDLYKVLQVLKRLSQVVI
jgi:hypothetical protein